jgi:5-methylcytosine-specific restriction endonuclease McrA
VTVHVSPESCPALVLNADYRPLSYYPLSLWSWQDAIKAICLDRVHVVSNYDRIVKSPSFEMFLPSVVSLKDYVKPARHPAFTRFNVFLRDRFQCQYCGSKDDLTFDHVIPRSKGGLSTWDNIVASCAPCNRRKGDRLPHQVNMHPRVKPRMPNPHVFIQLASPTIPATWKPYLQAA